MHSVPDSNSTVELQLWCAIQELSSIMRRIFKIIPLVSPSVIKYIGRKGQYHI